MEPRDAKALVEALGALNPHALALARYASLAVRIEPELLRSLRLSLLRAADASAEADLWFSGLVQSRARSAITLRPAVVAFLHDSLRHPSMSAAAARARGAIAKAHARSADLLAKEEAILYWLLVGDVERVETAFDDVLARLLLDDARGSEIAAWAVRALPKLRIPNVPSDVFGALPAAAFQGAARAAVEIEFRPGSLALRAVSKPAPATLTISIPAVRPLALLVASSTVRKAVILRPGHWVVVEVEPLPVELCALDGRRYELRQRATPTPNLLDRSVVESACARVEWAGRSGSGYLVGNSLLATSYQVARDEPTSDAAVWMDGAWSGARFLVAERAKDVAILELDEPPDDLAPLAIDAEPAAPGESLEVLGYTSERTIVSVSAIASSVSTPTGERLVLQSRGPQATASSMGALVLRGQRLVGQVRSATGATQFEATGAVLLRASISRAVAARALQSLADAYEEVATQRVPDDGGERWLALATSDALQALDKNSILLWSRQLDHAGRRMLAVLQDYWRASEDLIGYAPDLLRRSLSRFETLVILQLVRASLDKLGSRDAAELQRRCSNLPRELERLLSPESSEVARRIVADIQKWRTPTAGELLASRHRSIDKETALACCELLRFILLAVHVRSLRPALDLRHWEHVVYDPASWRDDWVSRVRADCEGLITMAIRRLIEPAWREVRQRLVRNGARLPGHSSVADLAEWWLTLRARIAAAARNFTLQVSRELFLELRDHAQLLELKLPTDFDADQTSVELSFSSASLEAPYLRMAEIVREAINSSYDRDLLAGTRPPSPVRAVIALASALSSQFPGTSVANELTSEDTQLPPSAMHTFYFIRLSDILNSPWLELRDEWTAVGLVEKPENALTFTNTMLTRAEELLESSAGALFDWYETQPGLTLSASVWDVISRELQPRLTATPKQPSASTEEPEVALSGMMRDFVNAFKSAKHHLLSHLEEKLPR